MNEILIAIMILFTAIIMFLLIVFIVSIDKKIIEIDKKVSEIKNINFSKLQKIINTLNKINARIKLGKIRKVVDIVLSTVSCIQIFLFYKKFFHNLKNKKGTQ